MEISNSVNFIFGTGQMLKKDWHDYFYYYWHDNSDGI